MKKLFYLLFFLCFSAAAKAAPGDTSLVQAHHDIRLEYYGDYDTTVNFPSGNMSFRNIYMEFTLGKYICPAGSQYCADWDYTVQTFLMTPGGDTIELGRLITPYGKGSRMPASWKGGYIFEVTDYYPLLKNNATVRVHYSGYSGGFTANVKFFFIEGTPQRNVVGITSLWNGNFNYGHGNTPINTALGNVSLTAPAGTVSAEAKFTVTGHGMDMQGCAEFCPNTYTMNLNNNNLATQNFWRDNCGLNDLYPQSGTWVYDRGGWCPGDKVLPFSHVLTGITSNSNYDLSVSFPPHTSTPNNGSQASYTIQSAVIYYGDYNKNTDAAITDVIAPNKDEFRFRSNPRCGNPAILVKNMGKTAVQSLKIEYGVDNSTTVYTWNGNLAINSETEILLPEPWQLRVVSGDGGMHQFTAKILEVNGQSDDDATNDFMGTEFKPAPKYPVNLILTLKTNKSSYNGFSETSWKIYDINDSIVAQRVDNQTETQYKDTLELGPGCYKLVVEDAGCDGLSFWANPSAGSGIFRITPSYTTIALPVNGYFSGDFGCGFTQYFTTDWPTSVEDISDKTGFSIEAFPNPAQENVQISLNGFKKPDGILKISDAAGRVVMEKPCKESSLNLNISSISNGIYNIIYESSEGKIFTRLVINR